MKNIYKMILVIAIAMMGSNSFNAAAQGPNHGRGPGYGRVENHGNHGRGHKDHYADPIYSHAPAAHHHSAAYHHAPAHRPRPVVHHRPAPRPRPLVVYRNNSRRIRRAIATAAAIEATRYAIGAIVSALPPYYNEVIINGVPYYCSGNILYRPVVINGAPCFEVVDNEYYY